MAAVRLLIALLKSRVKTPYLLAAICYTDVQAPLLPAFLVLCSTKGCGCRRDPAVSCCVS
jgi:hypothetical protein